MDSSIIVKIFDTDTRRLEETEVALRKCFLDYGVRDYEIEPVSCFLEIQRRDKINYRPALEVNGLTISVNREITTSMLEDCACRLVLVGRR